MAMAWPSVSPMVISAPRTFWRAACEIGVTSAKEAPRCGGWELEKTFSDNGLLHFCESNDVQVHGCLVGLITWFGLPPQEGALSSALT